MSKIKNCELQVRIRVTAEVGPVLNAVTRNNLDLLKIYERPEYSTVSFAVRSSVEEGYLVQGVNEDLINAANLMNGPLGDEKGYRRLLTVVWFEEGMCEFSLSSRITDFCAANGLGQWFYTYPKGDWS